MSTVRLAASRISQLLELLGQQRKLLQQRKWVYAAIALIVGYAASTPLAMLWGKLAFPSRADLPASARTGFERYLMQIGQIALSETPSVINVDPRVQVDPLGGFLIADPDEGQVRRYSTDGRLVTAFGRKGRGPGEFEHLTAAVRTRDKGILTVDINGRLSLFDSTGSKLQGTWRTPLGPVYEATALGDTAVLLAARVNGGSDSDLLHVWDVRSATLKASMFRPPVAPPALEGTYAFAGTADVTARADTFAAVFALSDSVYLFDATGQRLEAVPIPFQHFRRAKEPIPLRATLSQYREWASRFSAISQVFWTDKGDFLVQYYDTEGIQPEWRLLRMDRRGKSIFELVDSPELLAVSPRDSTLFFVEPRSETPNIWLAARMPK